MPYDFTILLYDIFAPIKVEYSGDGYFGAPN
jgi:hypothetical protein